MRFLFILFFFFVSINLFAQNDVTAILQKSLQASSQIKNGTYDARLKMKYLMKNDTSVLNGTCRFHHFPPDTLKGTKFELTANDIHVLYDGRKKTTIYFKDSLAVVHDKWKYPLKLTGSIYHLLSGFMVNNSSNFITNPEVKKQLLKDTVIDKISCYHIMLHPGDDETSQNIYRQLYIAKRDFYLMGESVSLDAHQHHQFTELFLQNIKTNVNGLNDNYGSELIPQGFYVKEYVPDQLNNLLSAGTVAPSFTLSLLDGKIVSLNKLKGKITVLYFWTAMDQQSRVRLLPLQQIYDKYSGNGVEVLGMNVSDADKEHLKKLLQGKKITFPQFADAGATSEKYNVLEVPTIYVIGQDGKIIEGFTIQPKENILTKLEKIITNSQ
ncbi:MAG: TlpA disulfide reductase family protein [Bacteroidia bacterium]